MCLQALPGFDIVLTVTDATVGEVFRWSVELELKAKQLRLHHNRMVMKPVAAGFA